MKSKEQLEKIREMSTNELLDRLKDRKEELFNLRFRMATGHLEEQSRIKQVRKEIARIHSVQRERELKIR
ncbi:MAG: 50S ribosomal protein L29 [Proteobacteria bacterium]|nr:50S ribosomal protein L29 [Pseudomonadota bacterium]